MNKIIFPLKRRMQGPTVADLQDALKLLLDRGALLASDEAARQELSKALQRERAEQTFGGATTKLVGRFQEERRQQPTGEVDEATAKALNALLTELGAFDREPAPKFYIVSGAVRREDGLPLQRLRVRAAYEAEQRSLRLGEDITDAEGRYTVRYDALPGVDAINLKVSAIDEDGQALASSQVVPNAKPVETIDLTVPIAPPAANRQTIEGAILLEHGLPAEKLKLRLYRRDFGGKTTLLSETTTVGAGRYAFSYDAGGRAVSLEVRAVEPDGTEVTLTKPLNDLTAESRANLNMLAPGSLQPLAAEYQRLSADLTSHVGNLSKLKDAKENAQQQDLSVLNRATGWDARLIALAAITERLAADPDVGLPSQALYGLLRAGLPSDKLLLAQVEPDVVDKAITKVRDAGIVELTDKQIADFKTRFTTFAKKARLAMQVPGSRSTYGDLLKSSGLPEDAQEKFAPVYLKHRGDGAQLWQEARKAGLEGKQIGRLQLQGKLAFLAGNSEAMTTRLLNKGLKDPVELAGQDFHSPAAWKAEVFEQAGIPQARWANPTADDLKKLEAVIPATYAGEKVEARLDTYAEDMARKVRLSYPTQVLARLMDSAHGDEKFKPLADPASLKLLNESATNGFRLGQTPVEPYFRARMTEDELKKAKPQIEKLKTLQRIYQITPCNEAMPVLTRMKITSAFDVMACPEEQFIAYFKAAYVKVWQKPAPAGVPELVSRKAKQVSSVTYNLFAIAKKLDSEPPMMAISGTAVQQAEAKSALKGALKAYPTMESLFGSMDYCECEHCRSVLSPAAYLVDLLQFVDTDPGVWGNFLAQWKEKRGAEYQADWKKPDGTARKEEERKPYDALIERRPDLPHIALTCENTHTALPYIDIVNEILEYYVANGKLAKEAARDTGDATTAELLAEPQNVIRDAYYKLREARYPLNLPFDLWLETVRKFCDYFETPLHLVLDVIRPDEDLFAPIQKPTNVGNATVSVANAAAEKLTNGMVCTYSAASTYVPGGEWKRISGVDAPDSGGPGRTTVTFVGTWASAPSAGDRLVSRPLDHRAAIFMESLGLSSAQVEVFADPNPLLKWHELYGFATAADATTEATDVAMGQRVDLNSAKALSRRLGVTYTEIANIVQTAFVNPELGKLSLLYKLDVSVRDAKLYKDEKAFYEANKDLLGSDRSALSTADQQRFDDLANKRPNRDITGWDVLHEVEAFEQRLACFAAAFDPPLNAADLRTAIQNIPFNRALVLADPDAGCNFDLTTLQYADGTKADPIAFLRINLFVRLWRKLGWTIEETDRALTTFVPRLAPFDGAAGNLAKQPLKTALIYLAHLKELDEKVRVGKHSRLKLLTLWSNIATTGKKPLYAQLFLNRSVLKNSPVFDHPVGQYLTDPTIKLKAHVLALQGALGLTADEIGRILSDAGEPVDTAKLSLANVSLLYRYGLLAKALKLSVRELIALKQLSGLDPFQALHSEPLETLDQDYPFAQTLEFVKVAGEIKESGLNIEDLEYLLHHRFDETGKYRPNREGTLALLKTIAEGVRAIRTEHAVPKDPGTLSKEVLRQKLGLALPPDVVERFLGMVNTTAEFTATKSGVNAADQFRSSPFAPEARIRESGYKEVPHKEQKLTVRGVLFDPAKMAMKASFNAVLTASQKQTFADLLDELEKLAREFFGNQLQEQRLRLAGEAGFLKDADFASLFAPLLPPRVILSTDSPAEVEFKQRENQKTEETNQEELQRRRYRIGQTFLPFLQERLIRQFIAQTMTAHTGGDPVLVESLVGDDRLLAAPKALLNSFAATAARGLDATFWLSADATGSPQPAVLLADADTSVKDSVGNPLRPAGDSARLEAYLEVPITGAYRFYVELDKQNAEAELRFPHRPESVLVNGVAGSDGTTLGDQPDEYLELKAGVLYRLSLELKHLNGGDARLLVQGETVPRGPLSQLALYPAVAMEAAERASTLLTKALQLVQSLGLSQREIRYLLTHASDFDGLSLSEMPTVTSADSPAERTAAAQRFARFRRLVAYARLKRALAGGTDDLIGVFEANETTAADKLEKKVYPLIAKLTRRDETTVKSCAEVLFAAPAFNSEQPLLRLWEALQVVERFGVPVAEIKKWTGIVNTAATSDQRFQIARDLKEAIKARFEPETWQRVAQPIFDKLRPRQRGALVSYILQQMSKNPETTGIETQEKLYEYFLVDPGMEPVVQTSRIRLAIGSLQLFIQRCLLNLESRVHPSTINSEQWEWIKRYRVWEANRKIFLFPENWLEPEFRDDKTHLFTELEGALLQGDVSSDLVDDAFLNYLKKLDELARLDICAMHIEDSPEPARRILHVFGRTYSQPHKYFYRRYAHQMWTPWEPVSAEIEGDHLAPVVWRDRLYLFWVTFMDKAVENPQPTGTAASTKFTDLTLSSAMSGMKTMVANKTVEVQLHWSEYLKGEWTTRESGGFAPVISETVPATFAPQGVFIHVSKEYDPADGAEHGVFIHMDSPINRAFYLAGRNSAPESKNYGNKPSNTFNSANTEIANRYSGSDALKVSYQAQITTEPGKTPPKANPSILQQGGGYTLLPCNNNLTALGVSEEAYRDATNPAAVKAAIESGSAEIASLIKPVFYQDNRHTFFVEPDVTERTIEEWEEWVTRTPQPDPDLKNPDWWKELVVVPEVEIPNPKIPIWNPPVIDKSSITQPRGEWDWLVNPGTAIKFGDALIGPTGQPGIEFLTGVGPAVSQVHVNINPGSDLAGGSTIVLRDKDTFARSGLKAIGSGLNIVGSAGFNPALQQNFKNLKRLDFGAGAPGAGNMGG